MPSGMPSSGPALALGDPRVGLAGHGERFLRRLDDEGVERPRVFDGVNMRVREFDGGKFFFLEAVARFG